MVGPVYPVYLVCSVCLVYWVGLIRGGPARIESIDRKDRLTYTQAVSFQRLRVLSYQNLKGLGCLPFGFNLLKRNFKGGQPRFRRRMGESLPSF
jgi:hypothetical protein